MMDDAGSETPTNPPQLPPPQPSPELGALPRTPLNEHGLSLDRDLEAEIKNGGTHNQGQLPGDSEEPRVQEGPGQEGLKDGQAWDQIMVDAVPTTDAIATAAIVTEQAQNEPAHAAIVVDPEISTPEAQNHGSSIGQSSIQRQPRQSQTSVAPDSNSVPAITAPQYTLLESRQAAAPQHLGQPSPIPPPSPNYGLPAHPEFIQPRSNHGHPMSLPPCPPSGAPQIQHNLPSQTPSQQQQPTLQNLICHFPSPIQSSPAAPGLSNDGTSHFKNMKLIPEPPDLQRWRERLFNVEGTIVLSEEEFQTYFPHVDNVYSHRSTQRYKRKPFISHYWDCRLKGRPPGTPKSADPNKKKRKRIARERNLCDVKIKITEYFPGALTMAPDLDMGISALAGAVDSLPATSGVNAPTASQPFGVLAPSTMLPEGHPGATGARYYTIQRVNGNGANGRSVTAGGSHRHTLEESDRIKKNSVQRFLIKDEKEKKKAISQQLKTYHKKASGYAWLTVNKHKRESDLKLYASCFCPFVQRVWIALEVKGIPYQYIEVDPYRKPDSLLEVNPRGLVPAIRHGNWACHESTVLLEYLDDLDAGNPLLPPGKPQLRAHCRLWADHVNRHIIPCFYRLLQEQDFQKQIEYTEELKDDISKLVNASHVTGPFFLGPDISFVDIQFAPWMLRLSRVLKPYRGWPDPEKGSRWAAWVDAIEANDQIMATTSSDELYLDSYQRYAENRPDTSMLANAINSGRPLP
ncbi:glutathione transferase [Coccidioides posadasii str. Silveira]|uniref:Glutathione transferase n=3 Tax=Coccidioides posadasii TaxID=199306 RepID=E9CVR9_COCPS|nr:glutathione transferase [Coccidioides posadasii str. Silveira]